MDTCFFLSQLEKKLQLEVTKDRGGKRGRKIKFNLVEIEANDNERSYTTVGVKYF
jgi:hypothetical protein